MNLLNTADKNSQPFKNRLGETRPAEKVRMLLLLHSLFVNLEKSRRSR